MKLFHGTYEKVAPIIKIGEFAMSGNNVFDGLFASPERDIAASHGKTVFSWELQRLRGRVSACLGFVFFPSDS